MTANRIQIKASLNDEKIVIPIGQTFEEAGREKLISSWEETELQDNINPILDYETTRYAHSGVVPALSPQDYSAYYEFYFISGGTFPTVPSFYPQNFTNVELSKNKKSFTRSFFKFDYFDSPYRKEQKLMFSIILPANNCKKILKPIDPAEDMVAYLAQQALGVALPTYEVYVPEMEFSAAVGRNEGYYIQWLKRPQVYEGDLFYMSCKFFNAKTGKSVGLINKNPTNPGPIPTIYDYPEWFYYEVKLQASNTTNNPKYNYTIRECDNMTLSVPMPGQQRGTSSNPIRFYEYVNP